MCYRSLLLRSNFRFRSGNSCRVGYGTDPGDDRAWRIFRTVFHGTDGDFEFDRDRYPAEYRICRICVYHRRIHRRYVYRRYRSRYPDGCCSGDRCYAGGEKKQYSAYTEKSKWQRTLGCVQGCILGLPDAGYHPWRYLWKCFHTD